MNVLAFDPATVTGWAMWSHSWGWTWGTLRPRSADGLRQLHYLVRSTMARHVDRVVFEDAYLDGKPGKANVKTLKVLVECRTRCQVICEIHRLPFDPKRDLIMPSVWQAGWPEIRQAKTTKIGSIYVASLIVGEEVKDHNAADAICLAEWARTTGRLEQLAAEVKK